MKEITVENQDSGPLPSEDKHENAEAVLVKEEKVDPIPEPPVENNNKEAQSVPTNDNKIESKQPTQATKTNTNCAKRAY